MERKPFSEIQNNVFVPFVSTDDNTSVEWNMKSSGLYGVGDNAFINCFPVKAENPISKESDFYLEKRQGFILHTNTTAPATSSVLENAWDNINCKNDAGTQDSPDRCFAHASIPMMNDTNVAVIAHTDNTTTKYFTIAVYRPGDGKLWTIEIDISSATYGSNNANWKVDPRDTFYINTFETFTDSKDKPYATTPYITVVWNQYDRSKGMAWYIYNFNWSGPTASIARITDTYFPHSSGDNGYTTAYTSSEDTAIVGNFAMLDGRAYIATANGHIFNSQIGSISNWTPTISSAPGFLKTYSSPDQLMGVYRYKHHIVAFSNNSIEFFSNEDYSPGSPLGRNDQATIKFGTISAKCVFIIDDTLYWIAISTNGALGVWKLDGYTPVKVSSRSFELERWGEQGLGSTSFQIQDLNPSIIVLNGLRHLFFNGIVSKVGDQSLLYGLSLYWNNLNSATAQYNQLVSGGTEAISDDVGADYYASGNWGDGPIGIPSYDAVPCLCIDTGAWWYATMNQSYYLPTYLSANTLDTQESSAYAPQFSTQFLLHTSGRWFSRVGFGSSQSQHFFDTTPKTSIEAPETERSYKNWQIPVAVITNYIDGGNRGTKLLSKVEVLDEVGAIVYGAGTNHGISAAYLGYEFTLLAWKDIGDTRKSGSPESLASDPDYYRYVTSSSTMTKPAFQYKLLDKYHKKTTFHRLGRFFARKFAYINQLDGPWRGWGLNLKLTQGL